MLFNIALVTAAPQLLQAAEECDSTSCVEPECRCWDAGSPGGYQPFEIPQMVFLTFDEAITVSNILDYDYILGERINPNGCPIGMTYFLTHDYSDYRYVNYLYKKGCEIALHSLRGTDTDADYWKSASSETWHNEMEGLKTIISNNANIPIDSIVGSRAPFVQPGGDAMIQPLKEIGSVYDASYHTRQHTNPPLWPFTRDFEAGVDCQNPPCPTGRYPGFWSIPMVNLELNETHFCSMVDQCPNQPTRQEQYDFLMKNFRRHYETNRAPFGIYAHSAWFQDARYLLDGYTDFLDEILRWGDVYIVTIQKGIEWMKNPTSLQNMATFAPWSCDSIFAPCRANECSYLDVPPGGDRTMVTCSSSCPNSYPWYMNPLGQ